MEESRKSPSLEIRENNPMQHHILLYSNYTDIESGDSRPWERKRNDLTGSGTMDSIINMIGVGNQCNRDKQLKHKLLASILQKEENRRRSCRLPSNPEGSWPGKL